MTDAHYIYLERSKITCDNMIKKNYFYHLETDEVVIWVPTTSYKLAVISCIVDKYMSDKNLLKFFK
jgi:hypothetical protein